MGVASNLVGICKGGRRELYILTSVRRIHGKRISDAELTIIFRKAQQAKASSQSYQSSTNKKDIKLIIIGIRLRRLVIIVS